MQPEFNRAPEHAGSAERDEVGADAEARAVRLGVRSVRSMGRAILIVLGFVVVVIPWGVFRILRVDSLGPGSGRRGGWVSLRGQHVEARSMWARPAPSAVRRRRPLRQWVAGAVVVVVLGALAVRSFEPAGSDSAAPVRPSASPASEGSSPVDPADTGNAPVPGAASDAPVPAAYADAPWYPLYKQETEWAGAWGGLYRPVGGIRIPDASTTYASQKDGVRLSWAPPACDCRRLTVWMYGSASLFGVGQRDGHTIPSELARAAWADGIALDVLNRGVPGDQHWQGANRFAWDMTRFDPPDLVIFYDGLSDVVGSMWLANRQLGDIDDPIETLTEEFLEYPEVQDAFDELVRGGQSEAPEAPEGVGLVPSTTVPTMSPSQVGAMAAERYTSSLAMSRTTASQHDLPVAWFWQPTLQTKNPVEGEPTAGIDDAGREVFETARLGLPAEVVDLSDVFDPIPRPLFGDTVRHNEEGARVVAEAIYAQVMPQLEVLIGSGGSGR